MKLSWHGCDIFCNCDGGGRCVGEVAGEWQEELCVGNAEAEEHEEAEQ